MKLIIDISVDLTEKEQTIADRVVGLLLNPQPAPVPVVSEQTAEVVEVVQTVTDEPEAAPVQESKPTKTRKPAKASSPVSAIVAAPAAQTTAGEPAPFAPVAETETEETAEDVYKDCAELGGRMSRLGIYDIVRETIVTYKVTSLSKLPVELLKQVRAEWQAAVIAATEARKG